MMVFLNGRLVPESEATVSVRDRGFLYGDGLFETVPVYHGVPFRWNQHLARLSTGATQLRIQLPWTPQQLTTFATRLLVDHGSADCVLRLALSRGIGRRGYSIQGADHPTLVMTVEPAPAPRSRPPPRWRLRTSSFRVPAGDRLATVKTASKLLHICARAEAEESGADEALLLNTRGHVTETAAGNLFWIEGETVCTAPLRAGLLAGVTRAVVQELCRALGWLTREKRLRPHQLFDAHGVFITLSTLGLIEAVSLDRRRLHRSPRIRQLREAYWQLVTAETGGRHGWPSAHSIPKAALAGSAGNFWCGSVWYQ